MLKEVTLIAFLISLFAFGIIIGHQSEVIGKLRTNLAACRATYDTVPETTQEYDL